MYNMHIDLASVVMETSRVAALVGNPRQDRSVVGSTQRKIESKRSCVRQQGD